MNSRFSVIWSEEDKEFVGLCEGYPSLSWLATTKEKALQGIKDLVQEAEKDTIQINLERRLFKFLSKIDASYCIKLGHNSSYYVLDIFSFDISIESKNGVFLWEDFVKAIKNYYTVNDLLDGFLSETNGVPISKYRTQVFLDFDLLDEAVSMRYKYKNAD